VTPPIFWPNSHTYKVVSEIETRRNKYTEHTQPEHYKLRQVVAYLTVKSSKYYRKLSFRNYGIVVPYYVLLINPSKW
jgi:hypothetical protein